MSTSRQTHYLDRLKETNIELELLEKQAAQIRWSRISLFILFGVGVWQYFSQEAQWILYASLTFLAVFFFLIRLSSQKAKKIRRCMASVKVFERELKALKFDMSSEPSGKEFHDPNHAFSADLDLFGERSIYQYLNRSASIQGKRLLAHELKLGHRTPDEIEARQKAVIELSQIEVWREEFMTSGMLSESHEEEEAKLETWVESPFTGYSGIFYSTMLKVLPLVSLCCLVLVFLDRMPFNWFLLYILLPSLVAGSSAKLLNEEASHISGSKESLEKYSGLLQMIESRPFTSEFLSESQRKLVGPTGTAQESFRELMRIVEGLDNRLNAVGWLMLNVFLLWDVRYGIRLRKWKEENKKVLSQWFEVIAEFELINSMATMTYNRPKLNFPKANDDNTGVKARTMGHLLLNPKERVDNDFIVDGERFFILTGANMAGKSTFLRALGTNWVLASMGSPVCAESFDWTPSPLFSSMRTSDSLADHESYFFAELKRLKFLIDETEKGNLFIILDEILKGTNSEDKARGSKLFVEKLLERDVKGIIATHDLSLCTLSEEYPKAVRNLSFEVEFTEDDLSFDYKLREGVCKNMNASFLLEKMGLINKSS